MEYADKLVDEVKLRFKKNETELRVHHVESGNCLARGIFDLRDNLDISKDLIIELG